MKHIIFSIIAFALISGCTVSTSTANNVLESAGYTDIKLDGHAWTGCGQEDSFSSHFKAKGPTGKPVKGVVCCGIWKDCTIRVSGK